MSSLTKSPLTISPVTDEKSITDEMSKILLTKSPLTKCPLTKYPATGTMRPSEQQPAQRNGLMDFQDLLAQTAPQTGATATIQAIRNDDLNNFFDLGSSEPAESGDPDEKPGQIILNQRGLEMQLHVDAGFQHGEAALRFVTSNNNPVPVDEFNLAVAVTKAYQIELLPASSTRLEPNGLSTVTQLAKLRQVSAAKAPRLRLKVNYRLNGLTHTLDAEVSAITALSS